MCLEVNVFSKLRTAIKDIVVYKVLSVTKGDVLITPFRNFEVVIGNTYTSDLGELEHKFKKSLLSRKIEKGLHSFKNISNAYDYKWTGDVIVECVIPKGSKYRFGRFNNEQSYVSDTLKYVKILK